MCRILSVLSFCFFLTSCSQSYKIEGTTSVNSLDGKRMYLKILRGGKWEKVDSAEVVHGTFSMKRNLDSIHMAALFMDNDNLMPVVLEDGKIKVSINRMEMQAKGTPLNTALYDFIYKKNDFENSLDELEQKEARLVMEGNDSMEASERIAAEEEELVKAMNTYIKGFITDNYHNILGPNVFLMLCSSLPYPIMTPEIDEIIKNAPASFKNHPMIKEFVTKANENMQLIEEHQRMQSNEVVAQQ